MATRTAAALITVPLLAVLAAARRRIPAVRLNVPHKPLGHNTARPTFAAKQLHSPCNRCRPNT